MSAPVEFRSAVGAIDTNLPGVQIGTHFPQMAKTMDRWSIVRSFAHGNSGHAGGTHYVMTGMDHPPADGEGMLLEQGAVAFQRWFGREPDRGAMWRAMH